MALSDFEQIFPSAVLASSDPTNKLTARKMTEWNITNIIRILADNSNGSFVISKTTETESGNTYLEFCIHGYYFKYKVPTGTSLNNLYAHITLTQETDTSSSYSEVTDASVDDDSSTSSDYTLQLTDSNGNIPDSSKVKFSTSSINFSISTLLEQIDLINGNK